MRKSLLIALLLNMAFIGYSQEVKKNFSVAYYTTKDFAFLFNQKHKLNFEVRYRPEDPKMEMAGNVDNDQIYLTNKLRFETGDGKTFEDGYFSFLVKFNQDIIKNKVLLSTGLGLEHNFEYSDDRILVPVDFKAYNLFNTSWIGCSAGLDFKLNSCKVQAVPKMGLFINF